MEKNGRTAVLFDDSCAMCSAQMRWLRALDWRGKLKLVPMSSPEVDIVAPQIPKLALQEAMHCITPRGRIYRGARAVRSIAPRVPLLVPLGALLWIPGMIHVADWFYAIVARNRYLLSRVFGCRDACRLPPARQSAVPPARSAQGRSTAS